MSRPKDFATWSAERQEKWREKTRQIARKSYAKNAIDRRRRVRVYKAKIRGTVLVEDGYAKKRVRRSAIRECTERGCSNTMVYRVWITRDKLCKSCKAKALREEKAAAHRRRRFYKLACAQGEFGKLRLVEISCDSMDLLYAADLHIVERFERDGSDMYSAYIRDRDYIREGRPRYGSPRPGPFKDFWVNWWREAFRKTYAAERRRAAMLADLPKARVIPKKVMHFFQMMAAAQAVGNYVDGKSHDKIRAEETQAGV